MKKTKFYLISSLTKRDKTKARSIFCQIQETNIFCQKAYQRDLFLFGQFRTFYLPKTRCMHWKLKLITLFGVYTDILYLILAKEVNNQ